MNPGFLERFLTHAKENLAGYFLSLNAVTGLTLIFTYLMPEANPITPALAFLLTVLAADLIFGLGPAAAALVAALLCLDFFILPPVGSLKVGTIHDFFALATLLTTSLIVVVFFSAMSKRLRSAEKHAEETRKLLQFNRELTAPADSDRTVEAVLFRMIELFDIGYCAVFGPSCDPSQPMTFAAKDNFDEWILPAQNLLQGVFETGLAYVSPSNERLPSELVSDVSYLPLRVGLNSHGVLVMKASPLERSTRETLASIIAPLVGAELAERAAVKAEPLLLPPTEAVAAVTVESPREPEAVRIPETKHPETAEVQGTD